MHALRPILFIALASLCHGNPALDLLEADKTPTSAPLVPTASGSSGRPPGTLVYPEQTWPAWQARTFDTTWARAVLFQNDANPYIQQIAITGFFDFQSSFGKAEVEGIDGTSSKEVNLDSTRTRRARLGARLRAFGNTEIQASGEIAGDSGHSGIERLSARTEILAETGVTYGKFRPNFSSEYRQEPEFSPYPDRSMLTNMIAPQATLGIYLDHRRGDWEYGAGWFSADSNPNIPSLEGNGLLNFNLARTFVEAGEKSLTRTRWHLDYLHNLDGGKSGSLPRYDVKGRSSANGGQLVGGNPAFRHLFSTGFTLEQDRFSFLGDFMLAKGGTTAWGLTLAPTWWAIPGVLNIVGRYHYAGSDESGTLVTSMGPAADPAFDDSPFFIGDEYHSFYLGTNAHLYQDRLLFMGGLENVILKDEGGAGFNTEAWIWHAGLKAAF